MTAHGNKPSGDLYRSPEYVAASGRMAKLEKQIKKAEAEAASQTGSRIWGELVGNRARWGLDNGSDTAVAASQKLREAGIPGIRYKDAGSRGMEGGGTNNLVVFDDKLIEIIRKYGIAGLLAGGGALSQGGGSGGDAY
jgi:hypothetical protein